MICGSAPYEGSAETPALRLADSGPALYHAPSARRVSTGLTVANSEYVELARKRHPRGQLRQSSGGKPPWFSFCNGLAP
jgi:hypothetical protein